MKPDYDLASVALMIEHGHFDVPICACVCYPYDVIIFY